VKRKQFTAVAAGLGVSLIGMIVYAANASANADQGGNHRVNTSSSSSAYFDANAANIKVTTATPAVKSCVIFSVVVENNDGSRQIEDGHAKCGTSTSLDGTCSTSGNLQTFVETFISGSGYTCYPHGTPVIGSIYHIDIKRISSTSGTYRAYNGANDDAAYNSLQGMETNNMIIWLWGEASWPGTTPVTRSGWHGASVNDQWQYYNFTSGWHTITSGTKTGTCWTVGTVSSGAFNVSH